MLGSEHIEMLRVPDVDALILEHLTNDANRLVIILNFVRTLDPVRIRNELTVDELEKGGAWSVS